MGSNYGGDNSNHEVDLVYTNNGGMKFNFNFHFDFELLPGLPGGAVQQGYKENAGDYYKPGNNDDNDDDKDEPSYGENEEPNPGYEKPTPAPYKPTKKTYKPPKTTNKPTSYKPTTEPYKTKTTYKTTPKPYVTKSTTKKPVTPPRSRTLLPTEAAEVETT